MWSGIISALAKFFDFVSAIANHARHRSELKNTGEMQDAASRQKQEDRKDAAQKAVRKKDTKKIQNLLGAWAVGLGLALAGVGCTTTVTPDPVESSQPSLDGNQANSGFLGFDDEGNGLITRGGRERYNALIERYGDRFLVPIQTDFGIKDAGGGTYLITAEALEKFIIMSGWYRDGS